MKKENQKSKPHPKTNHKPKHQPSKQKPNPKPAPKPKQQSLFNQFFTGNLAQNMNFGNKNHELSGYVQREVVIEDQHGNKQTAKEQQFFNSGKGMNVHVYGNNQNKNKSR